MSLSYFQPALPALLAVAVAGLIRTWRACKTHKPWLATIGIAGCFLLSWDPAAWLFSLPLLYPYSPVSVLPPGAQAIVVLSGKVYPPNDFRSYPVAGDDTYQRCRYAAWLHQRAPSTPILVSGGGSSDKPYALTMRELLESEGVPPDLIWTETRSASTHENAVYSARILREHGVSRIALVLETVYMMRAEACFRKQGIAVFPVPIGNGTVYYASDAFLPNWHAIESNGDTAHEILGLLWYRLHGWI